MADDPTPPITGAEVRAALEATKPPAKTMAWRNAVVIIVCNTVLSMIAVLAIWQWGSDKADQVSTLRAESECRSAIASQESVTGGALRLKETQLDRTRSASNQALQEAIVAVITEPAGVQAPDFRAALDRWAVANQQSATVIVELDAAIGPYSEALADRERINELCKDGGGR